jgi:Fe(3+) dicitrate transport protein
VGVRSTAVKGLTFDLAYFYSVIDDYQIKEAETTGAGANIFGTVDEVEINGFELYGRLDSQPFTGGPFNLFGEATYTFADSIITGGGPDEVGNYLPEVPRHFANLSVGVEERGLWNASVTWTHVGWFYTDTENTPYGAHPDGVQGLVPDVWLLSARANYMVPNTGLTLFVSGQNLEDKFYIADRVDGMIPGVGRTLWAGFSMKLQ